jgi:serine/threonine-protein kinase
VIDVGPADQLRAVLDDQATSNGHPSRTTIALSPDGQTIVFSAIKGDRQQLYARSLAQLEAVPLPDTEDGHSPFFSPDGRWVGFYSRGVLKKVPLDGDSATTICETGGASIFGASWGPNEMIVFARSGSGGLWQVSASGGKPIALTTLDIKAHEVSHRLPHFLPGTRIVMFT